MKKVLWINPIIFAAIILFIAIGCKKEEFATKPVMSAKSAGDSTLGLLPDTTQGQLPDTTLGQLPDSLQGIIIDADSNVYHTVTIGKQIWLVENLKTTKYNDGTPIPNITDNHDWGKLIRGAYCDHSNTPANSTTYGRLYNWYAVDNNADTKVASNGDKNVCPTGWHVPTEPEWRTLTDYLINNSYGYVGSGKDIAKSMAATSGWTADGTPGTVGNDQASNNSSGFTALPSSYRQIYGPYGSIGQGAYFWSSSDLYSSSGFTGLPTIWRQGAYFFMSSSDSLEYSKTNGIACGMMLYNYSNVGYNFADKHWGNSVRCLKD